MGGVKQPLAVDERGNALLAFDFGDETDLESLELPCPLSLVLVWSAGHCLMVFDRWKHAWELPGGCREDDETPRAAAVRELVEETGQTPAALEYVGVARFGLSDGPEEYGAVYQAVIDRVRVDRAGADPAGGDRAEGDRPEVDQVEEFEGSDEIERVVWWDPGTGLAGVDGTDAAIVRLVLRRS